MGIFYLMVTGQWVFANLGKFGMQIIFYGVGLLSLAASIWLTVLTKTKGVVVGRNLLLLAAVGGIELMLLYWGDSFWSPVWGLLGVAAVAYFAYLAWKTWRLSHEWVWVAALGILWLVGVSFYLYMAVSGMTNPPMQWGYPRTVEGFFHALTRGQYEQPNPTNLWLEPLRFLGQVWMLISGAAEEFTWVYMFIGLVPFAFFFQTEKRERAWLIGLTAIYLCLGVFLIILLNPTPDRASAELMKVFFCNSHTIVAALIGYGLALTAAFMATHYQQFRRWGRWAGAFATALAVYSLVQAAESMISKESGLVGIEYFCLALAFGLGLGMLTAIVTAGLAEAQYQLQQRTVTLIGIAATIVGFLGAELFMLFWNGTVGSLSGSGLLLSAIGRAFAKNQFGLPIYGNLVLVAVPLAFVVALLIYRERGPLFITLGLFLAMPLYSGLAHYRKSDQRGHMFGYWFGHDMFTPPFNGPDGKLLYPEMTKDAVLYGGTDPGRFCPTYMIFCESFTPHNCQPPEDQKFDRRDVYIITQNALADGTYLNYIRAHYNRSKQIDPPFFQELLRSTKEKEQNYYTNLVARLVSPLDTIFENHGDQVEKRRRTYTSWFTGKDFIDLPAFIGRLRPNPGQDPLSKFIYDNLSPETRQLLAGSGNEPALRQKLAADLNILLERELQARKSLEAKKREKDAIDQQISEGGTSERLRHKQEQLGKEIGELSKIGPLYDPERFKQVPISEYLQDFITENPQSYTRIRLNRLLLEAAYPKEIARSLGGVYPDREIYIATPEDSQRCFSEYLGDAQRRLQHDTQFPNEPRQLRQGEDVRPVTDEHGMTRVTVAGQVAVMAINGLLTKVMFDHNPKNEFFVEESFPLDWMYPHLTPYGIIMKINRQPLPALTEDILQKDHDFWKQYSKRMTGDIIDYDTPLSKIVEWIEKTYLRHDFNGFTGDRKFVHDEDAQKAFSKLRSSIGGIYAWRLMQAPPQYRPKSDVEFQRILKEAEFTFRQAFALCPYSPEAVFRYINLLVPLNRLDDALLIARTCLKLDPYNGQVKGLVDNLEAIKAQHVGPGAIEEEFRRNPNNFQVALELAKTYVNGQQQARAAQILDTVLKNPNLPQAAVIHAAQLYAQMSNWFGLEGALEKLVQVAPESPEAWYDLAAFKANLRKDKEALPALTQALTLNAKRLQRDPKAADLLPSARKDERFVFLRQTPEFQKLVPPK
jgi:tetratricopeptide (TPR) repeat protein